MAKAVIFAISPSSAWVIGCSLVALIVAVGAWSRRRSQRRRRTWRGFARRNGLVAKRAADRVEGVYSGHELCLRLERKADAPPGLENARMEINVISLGEERLRTLAERLERALGDVSAGHDAQSLFLSGPWSELGATARDLEATATALVSAAEAAVPDPDVVEDLVGIRRRPRDGEPPRHAPGDGGS